MKTYHICECCDEIFKTTETASDMTDGEISSLTGQEAGSIIMEENESDNVFVTGLCADCYEEVYGSDQLFYSYHGPH